MSKASKLAYKTRLKNRKNRYAHRRRVDSKTRFFLHVDKLGAGGCWIWTGPLFSNGYGAIWSFPHKRPIAAHRASWKIHKGIAAPKNRDLCHSCDVRACVNPAHLWIGTRQENHHDMMAKGRKPIMRGEDNPQALLTAPQVIEIRNLVGNKTCTRRQMAVKYGVSIHAIHGIILRRNWRHL